MIQKIGCTWERKVAWNKIINTSSETAFALLITQNPKRDGVYTHKLLHQFQNPICKVTSFINKLNY